MMNAMTRTSYFAAHDLRNVTLVGHSAGGAECVRYLTRHGSDRIARLALVAAITPMVGQAPDNPDGVPRDAIRVIRQAYAIASRRGCVRMPDHSSSRTRRNRC
jgi:pimeloyl-ACP methyl ester carboxylesterase